MRRYSRSKTDRNHTEIVRALKQCGWSVADLSSVGGGIPDLLVARNGLNLLVEIKDGDKPPSASKLRASQLEFIAKWKGPVAVVRNVSDVAGLG